jgi:hypothetical protein
MDDFDKKFGDDVTNIVPVENMVDGETITEYDPKQNPENRGMRNPSFRRMNSDGGSHSSFGDQIEGDYNSGESKHNHTNSVAKDKGSLAEDVTQYPEFVPSFHNWTTFEGQEKRAEELANMTDGE